MPLNPLSYTLPSRLADAVDAEVDAWKVDDTISRIWARDATVWTGDDEGKKKA